jgi:hypothetical protein
LVKTHASTIQIQVNGTEMIMIQSLQLFKHT